MKLMSISMGFLTGNIIDDSNGIDVAATAVKYSSMLSKAVLEEYPDVDLTIDWQDAQGVLPHGLKTAVYFDVPSHLEEFDYHEEERILDRLASIETRVWELHDWIVTD